MPTSVLEGRVQYLSIDMGSSKARQAVISMQIVILDETTAVTRLLFEKSYTQRTSLTATDPATAAGGWSSAYRALFIQITDNLPSVRNDKGDAE